MIKGAFGNLSFHMLRLLESPRLHGKPSDIMKLSRDLDEHTVLVSRSQIAFSFIFGREEKGLVNALYNFCS